MTWASLKGTREIDTGARASGGIERVEPLGPQMSFLLPDAQEIQKNVVTSFCHLVHFFPSRQAPERWVTKHAGTFLLSIHEAHVPARLKNEAQYRDVLP